MELLLSEWSRRFYLESQSPRIRGYFGYIMGYFGDIVACYSGLLGVPGRLKPYLQVGMY